MTMISSLTYLWITPRCAKRIDLLCRSDRRPGRWMRLSEATKQQWRDNAYP